MPKKCQRCVGISKMYIKLVLSNTFKKEPTHYMSITCQIQNKLMIITTDNWITQTIFQVNLKVKIVEVQIYGFIEKVGEKQQIPFDTYEEDSRKLNNSVERLELYKCQYRKISKPIILLK